MNSLNRQQRKAAAPSGGVSLVIAGAGTGKTKTLIEKIKNIIEHGIVKPENILILTFSRKAADEIKRRVSELVGSSASLLTAGTFHSFCLKLIHENSSGFVEKFGFKDFPGVLDDGGSILLMRELIQGSLEGFLGLPSAVILSLARDAGKLRKNAVKKLSKLGIIERIKSLLNAYEELKKARGCIDFEDMIELTIRMLNDDPFLRKAVMDKYRYILVDEFQDTSVNNFKLLKCLMPLRPPDLFIVGDDWQSIYGFRDSKIDYMINVKKFFPDVKIFRLNKNYRSKKEIVKLSNKFIRKNRKRTRKQLRSALRGAGKVKGLAVKNSLEELKLVKDLICLELSRSDEVAVLYRNNWQGNILTESMPELADHINSGQLKFMTMHSSKGLEFHAVILAGISDDIIPDSFSDIEEERRLMYVAMTRAKERLYIIYHYGKKNELPVFARELGFGKNFDHCN